MEGLTETTISELMALNTRLENILVKQQGNLKEVNKWPTLKADDRKEGACLSHDSLNLTSAQTLDNCSVDIISEPKVPLVVRPI